MSTTIGDVVEHTIGGGWGVEARVDADDIAVRIIRGADFPDAALRDVSSLPVRFESNSKTFKRTLRNGDIVLETSGGTKDRPTGRTILVTESMVSASPEPLIPASFCRLVRVARERADPAFVFYVMQNLYSRGGTWEFQNTSTGISNFQFELFQRTFRLPDFAIAEQQAIAEVLGALDDKIAANTSLASTAEQLLRTEIDAIWLQRSERNASLADFVDLNPRTASPDASNALYIDMKKLPESGWSIGAPDRRDAKGGARFRRGDTLLARITPCLENRKTGYVDNIAEGETGIGSTEFIVLRARGDIAAPVGFFLATGARFREFAIQNMVGTSGRQRVAAADLARFEMPKPDNDWLAGFGARTNAVFIHVESLQHENRMLAATRDALLPQLMSGKLRIRDAEAAASVAGA